MAEKINSTSRRRTWAAKNGDFIAIALISAFVTVLFYVVVTTTNTPRPTDAFKFGFSRDLDCRPVGFLEPVCTKRQTRR